MAHYYDKFWDLYSSIYDWSLIKHFSTQNIDVLAKFY